MLLLMKYIAVVGLVLLLCTGLNCQNLEQEKAIPSQPVVKAATPAQANDKTRAIELNVASDRAAEPAVAGQPSSGTPAGNKNLSSAQIIMMRRQQMMERIKKIQEQRQRAIQVQQSRSAPPAPPTNPIPARPNRVPTPQPAQPARPIQQMQRKTPSTPDTKSPIYCGSDLTFQRTIVQPAGPAETDTRLRLVATLYNFSMYVDAKDSTVSMSITGGGTWEPNYINLIGRIVKEGDNVMNLGSQSGLEALVMGKIIGPTGRMFIFEPYSFSNKMVTKNVEINGMKDYTTIYKVGASDQKSTATIQINYYNTGGSEIIPTPTNRSPYARFSEEQTVQINTVDSVLPSDVKLDFALLDVEKMETKALKGMKEVIARSPNLIIMTEWQYMQNPRRDREETMEVLNFMKAHNYRFYSYTGGNYYNCQTGRFFEYTRPEDLLNISFLDIFFIPDGHPFLSK